MVYDAKKLIPFVKNENTDDDERKPAGESPRIEMYYIDFAHAIPSPGNIIDSNCVESLRNLIYLFENFIDLYEMSLHGKVSIPELMKEREDKTP